MAAGIEDEPALVGVSNANDCDADAIGDEAVLVGSHEADLDRSRREMAMRGKWIDPPRNGGAMRFILLCAASGGFALLCTFVKGALGFGLLAIIVGAPVVEETAKIVLPMMWLEKEPWRFRHSVSIALACLASALVFATIENLLYFLVYIPKDKLGSGLVAYRLTVCTALHVGCSTLSAFGLIKAWREARNAFCGFSVAKATPYLVAAMVLHGVYNACVTLFSLLTSGMNI